MNKERLKGVIVLAIPIIVLVIVMITKLGLKDTILTWVISLSFTSFIIYGVKKIVQRRIIMSWIKIKELRMNTDTGIHYNPSLDRDVRDGLMKYAINFNEEMILFETQEQRDNAIKKLDEKLDIDNLFKTNDELFEENDNE